MPQCQPGIGQDVTNTTRLRTLHSGRVVTPSRVTLQPVIKCSITAASQAAMGRASHLQNSPPETAQPLSTHQVKALLLLQTIYPQPAHTSRTLNVKVKTQ